MLQHETYQVAIKFIRLDSCYFYADQERKQIFLVGGFDTELSQLAEVRIELVPRIYLTVTSIGIQLNFTICSALCVY